MSYTHSKTIGVILSGGAGHRFNGADKGLEVYSGMPLVRHVLDAVSAQVDDIILCANRNLAAYQAMGYPVITDTHSGYQGPIAGIIAALSVIENQPACQEVLISSCDSPALPDNYVGKLTEALGSLSNNLDNKAGNKEVAVVNDGVRNQNLHCLIRRSAWHSLGCFFQEGGRAMHEWHKKISSVEVDFSEQADCFININSADQLM